MWKKQEGCISWIDTVDQRDEDAVFMEVLVDISDLTRRLLELLSGDISHFNQGLLRCLRRNTQVLLSRGCRIS